LQRIERRAGQRHDQGQAQQWMDAKPGAHRQNQERQQYDQVAVSDVDEAQHANGQRQSQREHAIQSAQKHTLHELICDRCGHLPYAPK
jgi:hypothetical protein